MAVSNVQVMILGDESLDAVDEERTALLSHADDA